MATFDEAELLDHVDGDLEFLTETIEMLTSDGHVLMQGIREALATSNAAALAGSAHALKGMISNFCAPEAHAAALEVEQIGREGDMASAPAAADRLEQRLEALIADLLKFVAEKRS